MTVPCGLWHDVQVILPSHSGMWDERICWARLWIWQEPQVSISAARANWARDEWSCMTLWQPAQVTSRESWGLPVQNRRSPLVWHARHASLRRSGAVGSSLAKVISLA